MRAAVCRAYGAARGRARSRTTSRAAISATARYGCACGAAAVNFPDVLLVADEYQMHAPVAVRAGQRVRGRGDRGRRRRRRRRRRATVSAAPASWAPSARRRWWPAGVAHARPRWHRRRGRQPRSAWRTAPPTTCFGRWPRLPPGEHVVVLGAGGGVGLAAVQLAVLLGATVTAVASSDEKLAVAAQLRRRRPRRPSRRRPAFAVAGVAARAAPTSSSTPSAATSPNRRCDHCAGAAASSRSATRPA